MTVSVKSMVLALCGAAVLLSGCSLIDQDLRACDTDYTLDYELSLVTNLTTEINAALDMETDVNVAAALKEHLSHVFTDRAHDVDLSFYNVEGPMERLHHEFHIMDASQTSYTLYIPVREYMHLAVANLEENTSVDLQTPDYFNQSILIQEVRDTVPSQKVGIFTARLPMDIKEGEDQVFHVNLSMANSAAVVVLDTLDSRVTDIKVYAEGFATGFMLADSTYRYDYTPVVQTEQIPVKDSQELCFSTVVFPSRRARLKAEESLWEFHVYSTMVDGLITETRLGVKEPLDAGHVRIIKAKVQNNGSLVPEDETVAVSVQLEWTPGMEHEIIL